MPPKNLTAYNHVPDLARVDMDLVFQDSPLNSRSLDVCLIGPPNAGKSSLLNSITGKQVSAVSNKYNTTDEVIKGIYTNVEEKT